MRVLLDECVPRALREQLPGHEVKTVTESGWAGVKNGELQNFLGAAVAVVVMHAPSNDIAVLQPLMPKVLQAIPGAARGKVTNIRG